MFHGEGGESISTAKMIGYGGLFCLAETFLLYPIEVCKTVIQVNKEKDPVLKVSNRTYLDTARKIFARDGIRGFFRGFTVWAGGGVPSQMLFFGVINYTHTTLKPMERLGFGSSKYADLGNQAIAAAIADVVSMAVWTPFDVLGQRLMLQTVADPKTIRYRNNIDAFRKVWHKEGIRGFYRGFGAAVLTSAPASIVWYASYENFKPLTTRAVDSQGLAEFIAGFFAGLVSMVVSNPFDVIKTRIQTQDYGTNNTASLYGNTATGIRRIIAEEGLRALMKGLTARVFIASFSSGVALFLYETTRRMSTV